MSLNRRHFIFLVGASAGAFGLDACAFAQNTTEKSNPGSAEQAGVIQLPPLPYAYNALEPHIDAKTMQFHHDKHHAAYVKNLNEAFKKHPEIKNKKLEDLLVNLETVPKDIRTKIRNNGGGHLNHSMFWQIMKPNGGGEPTGAIASAINQRFGSFAAFKQQFNEAGSGLFGSGWVWLIRDRSGKLQITTTPNQDSPIANGNYPIFGNDVWEHAYYLNYQNRRADYLNAWWNVINWDEVNKRFAAKA
ncbi:superoxide dismutase [Aetokthonos hydrillicola Thurmond2011]|jgi:Fe-Mn family superoxide dismutase|uniref:Superoxide dismutase n=1 Tax=Aetokthonos hydrillicola Thurmond2011 TaxID=2712845 RepID=A0AAP5IER5_9CYAN|nr:superoxide dismutase [Aetokthonos hydrillicola]MBO3463063.1 superoxide dismutase [Aetokthonos hydrillicola CCALA 1050]MBW4591113.1 superoxide dismutase [Aetokthonos hydrillicola CCALA 1050]MDR9900341.1 superoxide dismutase [Aetokthonos hydrillicola Thurmond2011]